MSGVRRHYSAPAGRSNRSLMRASRTRAAGPSGAIMEAMHRGTLRIYLGAAPGVGKTYAMLGEAHRRSSRGTDVVIGLVETHGRPHTAEQLEGLEVLPQAEVTHRGVTRTELDIEAVLARRPEVVVIDELALHGRSPSGRRTGPPVLRPAPRRPAGRTSAGRRRARRPRCARRRTARAAAWAPRDRLP